MKQFNAEKQFTQKLLQRKHSMELVFLEKIFQHSMLARCLQRSETVFKMNKFATCS